MRYRSEILTPEHQAKDLGGIFGLLLPGNQVPYHYHKNRESIIIVISGEAIEIIEGKEFPIKAGDVLFIPPGEKHTVVNRSGKDFRTENSRITRHQTRSALHDDNCQSHTGGPDPNLCIARTNTGFINFFEGYRAS